jgi:hypothetical protein
LTDLDAGRGPFHHGYYTALAVHGDVPVLRHDFETPKQSIETAQLLLAILGSFSIQDTRQMSYKFI